MTDPGRAPWPLGQGEMARRTREHDWAATPLGPSHTWPQSLRTAVEFMLSSGLASALHYGPDLLFFYNDGWAELFGVQPPEALGRASREALAASHPDFETYLERVLRGETLRLEDQLYSHPHDAAHPRAWVSLTYSPLRAEDGTVAGLFRVAIETTEWHRAEAARQESEEQFRAFVNATSDVMYHMSPDWSEMHELNGKGFIIDTEDPNRSWLKEYIHPDDQPRVLKAIQQAVRSKSVFELEHQVRQVDGRLGWTLSRAVPLLDAYGEIKGWFGAASNVTERKQTQEAMREREETYRTLFASIDEAFALCEIIVDERGRPVDYRLLEVNPAFEQMTGITPSAAHRRTARELIPTLEAEWIATCGRAALHRETIRFESHIAGLNRWFDAYASPVGEQRDGKFALVFKDISERRSLQEQREKLLATATAAQAQAEETSRAKDEFLATLSHELRTPLAPILLWSRALRSGAVPMDDLDRALEAIVQSAESQSRLIEDLLDLSRLQSGKLLLAPRSTSVEGVSRTALEVIRPSAQAKGVTLEFDAGARLGTAVLDPDRFQQVLCNLLSNAVRFTPEGGRVSLRLRQHEGQLEVEVADTGQGIAEEFLPHLFRRFRQADMGEKRQHTGLGIGLALCHQLVELHGGTIEARSEGPGRGAVFTVRLPWVDGGVPALAQQAGPRTSAVTSASLHGVGVLLVEDDANTRDVMRWTLERAGAEVFTAGSGAQALALLEQEGGEARQPVPHVIVCDIGLPGMSGYEFIERVVERCRARGQPPLPACAVSAHALEVDRRRAIEAGFELYMAKPVSAEDLLQAVEELAAMARRDG